jgi:phosphate transport system substrate-binding protein
MSLRTWLAVSLMCFCATGCGRGEKVRLEGAGATFPKLLYETWFNDYYAAHPNIQINYNAVGSGTGVQNMIDGTVDFGASDAAMSEKEVAAEEAKTGRGVMCLPLTAGSIVLAYNVPGVPELKLSREAYVGIFLGDITQWDDPKIKATNPEAKLPSARINVIVREDSSGTTYVLTRHLSAISEQFKKSPGVSKAPNWKVGTKAKGNDGIAAGIKMAENSIGYIEYGYLLSSKELKQAALENKDKQFVKSSKASNQASLAGQEIPENMIVWNDDPAGKDSYPIVTYTWLLCYKKYSDKAKMDALKGVIKYALHEGQKDAPGLGFIPLPAGVVSKVEKALDSFTLTQRAMLGKATPLTASVSAR